MVNFIAAIGFLSTIAFAIYTIVLLIRKDKARTKWALRGVVVSLFIFVLSAKHISDTNNKSDAPTGKSVEKQEQPKKEESQKQQMAKSETMQDIISKDLKDAKIDISSESNTIIIQFKGSNLSEDMFVKDALTNIIKCFRDVYKNEEFKMFQVVKINTTCEIDDKYGSKKQEVGLSLIFDQTELQKVTDFNNITMDQLVMLQGKYKTGVNAAVKKGLSPEIYSMLYPNK